VRFENRILIIALFGAAIAFPSLDQTSLPRDLSLEGNKEMLSLYSASPSQEQESSTSIRKKIAVAVVILTAACGLGLWLGIQMALHVSLGHS
jgi:hypothetical protein